MFVGPQVVDPEFLCPGFLSCGFAVEEEDVGLDALRIEETSRQTQQSVHIGLLEQLAADGFTGTAFEEDVVGDNDRGAAVLLQNGKDVVEEVELFVARARPEIIAMNN
jgi:hypothetical protein